MKFFDRLENTLAVCLIVFFLFPWVSIYIISFNGFQIPTMFSELGALSKDLKGTVPAETNIFYLLYLIPVCSAAYLFFALKKNKNIKLLSLTAGLITPLIFTYALIRVGVNVLNVVGIGAWLSLLSGIGMVLAALGILKKKNTSTTAPAKTPSNADQ